MSSSSSTVKLDGAEGADKTVIHVHITQESFLGSLGSLLKALAARRGTPKPGPKGSSAAPPSTRAGCNAEQKVLGGAQILLGLVTIAIGCLLTLGQVTDYEDYMIFGVVQTGAPFWSGGVLIVAGALSVVGERRGGGWVHLATFFHLASVVACSVALAVGEASLPNLSYDPYYITDLCRKTLDRNNYFNSWETVAPAWQAAALAEANNKAQECEEKMRHLWKIAAGLKILLLVFCIAALLIAVFCLGNGLRLLCCSLLGRCEDYRPLEDPEVAPLYEEPPKEENVA